GHAAGRSFAAALVPTGLEPRQFAAMNYVALSEGESQKSLAAAVGIPASRMVAIVDSLEAAGLVERRVDPQDRRHKALFLTAAGKKSLQTARRAVVDNERKLFASLGADQRDQLLALLHEVAAELGVGGVHPELTD